jgi:riboflavin synthase
MFTGIVTDVGQVRGVEKRGDTRLTVATRYDAATLEIGASIACAGTCLTVVARGKEGGQNWFAADVSAETLAMTTLGGWREGTRINLERSLKVGEELGGHIVTGHVDGRARIEEIRPEGDSLRVKLRAPAALARFIAPKGAVALDGVSLTVNEVEGDVFGVNIIPHTREVTTWGEVKEGSDVNLEVDVLARYVARLNAAGQAR